jgi:GTP pyrophosphokinase
MLLEAKKFAEIAHTGDTYGDFPYTKHLNDVYNTLIIFGIFDELALTISWLHDVIEDTQYVYEDIYDEFGREVADITYLVTDKRGRNRKERQKNTYPELAKHPLARLIKLADRISNVTMTTHDTQEKFVMYEKEYDYFKEVLTKEMKKDDPYHEIEVKMWDHLDKIFELGPFIDY